MSSVPFSGYEPKGQQPLIIPLDNNQSMQVDDITAIPLPPTPPGTTPMVQAAGSSNDPATLMMLPSMECRSPQFPPADMVSSPSASQLQLVSSPGLSAIHAPAGFVSNQLVIHDPNLVIGAGANLAQGTSDTFMQTGDVKDIVRLSATFL